jgi:deoxyribodipyrimidine photolyase-related protein
MQHIVIVPPHHLFQFHPAVESLKKAGTSFSVYLIEEELFFRQYVFHKQKIAYHRATMSYYADYLRGQDINVVYISSTDENSDIRRLIAQCGNNDETTLHCADVTDDWLKRRIAHTAETYGIEIEWYQSPMFLNSTDDISDKLQSRSRLFQTDFYIAERKERKLLLDEKGKPLGGSWTYDAENRLKYPKQKTPPLVLLPETTQYWMSAVDYVDTNYANNYGLLDRDIQQYPITHAQANVWLKEFLSVRLNEFGAYEDAIVASESILHHSVLTPMLNIGLLTPNEVIETTIQYVTQHEVPLASTEGFIRQIVGWREFIRGVYHLKGRQERTRNFWQFKRSIPSSFWDGTTGIEPIDIVIRKVLKTGYCHHIERLMVLGNFMLLCEFDPDEVYRWFMEMFIDSYDWVMVPNIYGMSQFADGGMMSTKPYISGSNYLIKMSNFSKGSWQNVWDALFWRFMHVHRDYFGQNPRLGMLLRTFDAMPIEKQNSLLTQAEQYLSGLDKNNS